MQDADAMHIVQLETLHLRAIDQRGMRRRQLQVGAPDRHGPGRVDFGKHLLLDVRPGQVAP